MQLPLPFKFRTSLDINSFISTNNQDILYHLDNVIEKLDDNLLIYGKNYGKTHLLNAYTAIALDKKLKVIYLNLETSNELIDYIPDDLDIIFIDNLDKSNSATQKKLFDLYNKNNKIVLSSHTDNNNLELLPDLTTRINKSIKLKINPINDEDKVRIIQHKIKIKNLKFSDKSIKYLFNNYSRDLKKLIDIINILDEKSLVAKKQINSKFIKEVLSLN